MRDAETVRLVPDMHEHLQGRGIAVDKVRIRVARHYDLLQPLGQTDKSHLPDKAQFAQRLVCRVHLPAAAVYDYQLRQFLTLGQQAGVSPVNHLLHGREVVGPHHCLDIEMPVVPLRRGPVPEHHARRHRIGPLDIGVVETLDMHRRHIHAEVLAQILHYTLRMLLGIDELLMLEPLELYGRRILTPQLQKREPIAFLRHSKGHTRQSLRHIRQEWHDDFGRMPFILPLIFLQLLVYAGDKRA